MNVKHGQNKPAASRGDSSDMRVVAIDLKPGPDAPDRLRRLFTLLLVTCVTRDGQLPPRTDSAPEDGPRRKADTLASISDSRRPGLRRLVLRHSAHGRRRRVPQRPGPPQSPPIRSRTLPSINNKLEQLTATSMSPAEANTTTAASTRAKTTWQRWNRVRPEGPGGLTSPRRKSTEGPRLVRGFYGKVSIRSSFGDSPFGQSPGVGIHRNATRKHALAKSPTIEVHQHSNQGTSVSCWGSCLNGHRHWPILINMR